MITAGKMNLEQEEILHLYNQTFNAWNLVLMASAWVTLRLARQILPEIFAKQPPGTPILRQMPHRLMPVYPIVICTAFYLLVPGPWVDETLGVGQRALLGVLCGFVAGHSHAVMSRVLPEPLKTVLLSGKKPPVATENSDTDTDRT